MLTFSFQDLNLIHFNSPKKLDVKNKNVEYFRNHFLTFLQYDGNLLRRDLIQCSNKTLYLNNLGNEDIILGQNNAKENFNEQELPPDVSHNNKEDEHNNNILIEANPDIKYSGKKETDEDELCYELKRNRYKVYR